MRGTSLHIKSFIKILKSTLINNGKIMTELFKVNELL